MNTKEAALIAEIQFWQEMIKTRGETASSEAIDRMQHALLLAEKKLQACLDTVKSPRHS